MQKRVQKTSLPILIFLFFWVIYCILSFSAPSTPEMVKAFDLTPGQINLVKASLALMLFFIWTTAFFATHSLWDYLRHLHGTKEAKGYKKILWGLIFFLVGLIEPSFIDLLNQYNFDIAYFKEKSTLFSTYLILVTHLIGMLMMMWGCRDLLKYFVAKPYQVKFSDLLLSFNLSAIYGYLFIQNVDQFYKLSIASVFTFLPPHLSFLSIILPYMVMWHVGIVVVRYLVILSKEIPGKIYKKAFHLFANGIMGVVGVSILFQWLNQILQLYPENTLFYFLGVMYLIFLITGISYFYLARGVMALKNIETV